MKEIDAGERAGHYARNDESGGDTMPHLEAPGHSERPGTDHQVGPALTLFGRVPRPEKRG